MQFTFTQLISKLNNAGFTVTTGLNNEGNQAPIIYLDDFNLGFVESCPHNCEIIATSETAFHLFNEHLTGVTIWPMYGEYKQLMNTPIHLQVDAD